MRLLMPCRYDCEQNNLVDEENCGSFDCGLRIADCGFIEYENHAVIAAPLAQDSSPFLLMDAPSTAAGLYGEEI
jgi:hypothetical protein